MHRLGNVLHCLRAQLVEAAFKLALDLAIDVARDADTARLRQSLEPCRYIDAVAIEIASLYDDVAEIDADAKDDTAGFRQTLVCLGEAFLYLDRAVNGINRAGEFNQHSIAHHLDETAAMLCDQRSDHFASPRLQGGKSARFVLL